MDIIEEYRNRIRQADTSEEKKVIAAELHNLADSFDDTQRANYENCMLELHRDIVHQLQVIDPMAQRAEAIVSRYLSVVKS